MVSKIVQPTKSSLPKESIELTSGGGVKMGRTMVNGLDQFIQPPYQILASQDAQNPLKSLLWWWVVVVVEADFSVKLEPQAEQLECKGYRCPTSVSPVFHYCSNSVPPLFHQCFTIVYQCFTSVSSVFHQCFTSV